MSWYDCLLLTNRILTTCEQKNLDFVELKSVTCPQGVMIGPKESLFLRPMDLQLTHHHHLNAVLSIVSCYIYPQCQAALCYPASHVEYAEEQKDYDMSSVSEFQRTI